MRKTLARAFAFACAFALAGTAANAAPTARTQTPAPTWSYAHAFEGDIHGSMDVATTKKLLPGTVPVLSRFDLRFTNGDHEMRRIGILAKSQTAAFSFADVNNDDPFEASATWAVLDQGKTGKVSAVGGGVFEIPIPGEKPAAHTLVLSGFEFRRADGTDANIRAIGVLLNSSKKVVRVSLVDDQGFDFGPFIASLGKVLVNIATMGVWEAATSHADAVGKLNSGKFIDGFRPYAVTVQYAWIPNTAIAETGMLTGTSNTPSSNMKLVGDMGLTGFEFAFTNSDHHLQQIAVRPHLPKVPGIQPGAGEIRFKDQNEDDPKKWAVNFVKLK